MLEVPLPLTEFQKKDEDGNIVDGEYYTIPEYLATRNHTVERYSNDGYFIKGFGFNYDGLKELESKLEEYGMSIGTNFWVLSPAEVQEELAKEEWDSERM